MRFLNRNKKSDKTVIVISDLHLGAGDIVNNKKNVLEDFRSDEELVDFFEYYSTGDYLSKEVELIINGDFLDLLAVPYVPFFDDEFWSEEAALAKLSLILNAHKEVIQGLADFVSKKNKKLTYIIGNHDGEMVFDSLKEMFFSFFAKEDRQKIVLTNEINTYNPVPGVYLEHGHNYEVAHKFDQLNSIVTSTKGRKYFIPSWGAYYVTHVINRYKQERDHVNTVRPIRKFLIHGLIFDTLFTLRFMIANAYYFLMVRLLFLKRNGLNMTEILKVAAQDLTLFQDYEELTRKFFQEHEDAKVLIVGHTHEPTYREYSDGSVFINTGTWTKMVSLDLDSSHNDYRLSFALVEQTKDDLDVSLNVWAPKSDLPYYEFN